MSQEQSFEWEAMNVNEDLQIKVFFLSPKQVMLLTSYFDKNLYHLFSKGIDTILFQRQ